MPAPAQFTKAKLEIEGKRAVRRPLQPDRVLDLEVQRVEVREGHGHRRSPPPQFGGGNPRELTLNLLLDASLLGKDAARPRHHRRAVQDDGGARRLRRPAAAGAAPPFVTFTLGQRDDVQVRLHVADRRLQALPPQRRPDPRRREDDAQAGRGGQHGVRPTAPTAGSNPTTRANAGHGVHTVKDGDTLPSIAYEAYGDATDVARDRRRQRDREPAAPAPRPRAEPAEAGGLMPAARRREARRRRSTVHGRRRAAATRRSRDAMLEVRVRDTLALPGSATVRLTRPRGRATSTTLFTSLAIGKEIEIKTGRDRRPARRRRSSRARSSRSSRSSRKSGAIDRRSARSTSRHRLQRQRKVRTFQQMSASRHRQARSPARPACQAQVESRRASSYKFFQQSARDRLGLHRPARARPRLPLLRRATASYTFKTPAAATGAPIDADVAGQPDQLPAARVRRPAGRRRSTCAAGTPSTSRRSPARASNADDHEQRRRPAQHGRRRDFGGGTTLVADRLVDDTAARPTRSPRARSTGRADAYRRGRGRAASATPTIKAGGKVKIKGVGTQVRRRPTSSPRRPTSTAARRATRRSFQISGRSERGLLDLVHPPEQRDWSRAPRGRPRDQQQRPRQAGPRAGQVPHAAATRRGEHLGADRHRSSAGNARGAADAPAGRRRGRSSASRTATPAARSSSARSSTARTSPATTSAEPGRQLRACVSNEKAYIHTKKDIDDQERQEDDHRGHQGRDDQGAGQDRAGGHAGRRSSRPARPTRSRPGSIDDDQGRLGHGRGVRAR